MAAANQALSIQQAETDIAVLQVQVQTIEEKVGEIKTDVKEMQRSINDHAEETQKTLKAMAEISANAHKEMSNKISSLEKWRWMMMGAGVVIGSLGFDTLGKLLK